MLTEREGEIVDLVARGLTSIEIGRELGITVRTVQTHLCNIFDKLGVRNRVGVLYKLGYMKLGYIRGPS